MTSLALKSHAGRPSWIGESVFILAVWALVSAALVLQQLPLLAVTGPQDPDSQMRLVEVRDFLAGAAWTDMLQPRIAPPDGIVMHWSRLIDWPLATLIRLADGPLGREKAELFAITAWPLMLYLVFFFGMAAVARKLLGSAGVFPAVAFAIFAGPALGMFMPGHITHHNAQIALFAALLALAVRIDRSETVGVLAGCIASIMLSIGLETLPLIGLVAAGMALAWAFGPARFQPGVRGFGLFFAAGMVVQRAFAAAPSDWLSTHCDIASYPYVAVAVVGGLGLAALTQHDSPRLWVRLGGLAVLGGLSLAVVAAINPTCLKGPYAEVDPRLLPLWLDKVSEARTIAQVAQDSVGQLLAFYLAPFLALFPTAMAVIRAPRPERFGWGLVLACLATALAVTMWELRGATFASVLAGPGLAWGVLRVRDWSEGKRPWIAAAALLAAYVVPNQYLHMIAPILADKAFGSAPVHAARPAIVPSGNSIADAVADDCSARPHYSELAVLPPGVVLVGSNLGPSLLLHTPHSAVSAPFHRNTAGILDGFAAFGGDDAAALEVARRRHAGYVMLCSRDDEMDLIARAHPDGLAARLRQGRVPGWLQPVPTSGLVKVWRVVDGTISGSAFDPMITGSTGALMPRLTDLRGAL